MKKLSLMLAVMFLFLGCLPSASLAVEHDDHCHCEECEVQVARVMACPSCGLVSGVRDKCSGTYAVEYSTTNCRYGSSTCMVRQIYYYTGYMCVKCGSSNEVPLYSVPRHLHREEHGCGRSITLCTL